MSNDMMGLGILGLLIIFFMLPKSVTPWNYQGGPSGGPGGAPLTLPPVSPTPYFYPNTSTATQPE